MTHEANDTRQAQGDIPTDARPQSSSCGVSVRQGDIRKLLGLMVDPARAIESLEEAQATLEEWRLGKMVGRAVDNQPIYADHIPKTQQGPNGNAT